MNKMSKLAMFESEANASFSNYGGSGGFIGEQHYGTASTGFIGNASYAGADNRLNDADRTLSIVITNANTSGGTLDANLFGGFAQLAQPAGVTINVKQSSHAELRAESTTNPMFVKGFKYIVDNEAQFDEVITIAEKNATGRIESYSFDPVEYRTNMAQINTQIDANDFSFVIDGNTQWSFPIQENTVAKLVLQIRTRVKQSELLRGASVIETTNAKNPTGLPALDQ